MSRLLLCLLLVGCGGATPTPAPPRAAPTEDDACARICESMTGCGIAPASCAATCARDQRQLRVGVHPAHASCLERELARCDLRSVAERRQVVAVCWSAVMEAYAKDHRPAVTTIVRAICGREQRCTASELTREECERTLEGRLVGSARGKALALARPERLTKLASCIEAASCAEPSAISACADREEP